MFVGSCHYIRSLTRSGDFFDNRDNRVKNYHQLSTRRSNFHFQRIGILMNKVHQVISKYFRLIDKISNVWIIWKAVILKLWQ